MGGGAIVLEQTLEMYNIKKKNSTIFKITNY